MGTFTSQEFSIVNSPQDGLEIRTESFPFESTFRVHNERLDDQLDRVRNLHAASSARKWRARTSSHGKPRIHSGETRELKRGAVEKKPSKKRMKKGYAGGKPIDSRNTLGHGLLPHSASGFYLLDTHQSRISARFGLRTKLM